MAYELLFELGMTVSKPTPRPPAQQSAPKTQGREAAPNRAANVGRADVDRTPTVISGRVASDADLRVGRFSLTRDGWPDLDNAVLPANWADDPLRVKALTSRFDVLDVRGAKAAGLNLDTDRFLVFHESAGDVIRFAE